MATYTEISYGLVDVTAKEDSTPTCQDKQPFIDMAQLKRNNLEVDKYGTGELNQFVLDGSMKLFPDNPYGKNFGLWSLSMSDENGVFKTPITLTVDFTENHSSLGLTFFFMAKTNDYCNNLNIKYYDGGGVLLLDKDFAPDEPIYFAEGKVTDYRKVVTTFKSTNYPFRYLKLSELKYGAIKIFKRDDIVTANILEEVDPTSSSISINTLEFTAHSKDFSLLDPQGLYSLIQKKQDIEVSLYQNDIRRDMGTFYLEEPESQSDDTVTMSCIDALGIMDQTDFKGGLYNNKLAKELVSDIMASAGFSFELASSFDSVTLTGWIPICTHRVALQQVAFAIGAIVDCSRSSNVRIYPIPTLSTLDIGKDRKIQGHKVKQRSLVTGVEVIAHKYIASTESAELYKGVLPVGTHEIVFSEPKHTLTVTGGTILSSNVNYAKISVTTASEITLTGKNYNDTTSIVGVYMPELPANEKQNILQVDAATLINESNAKAVAQRLYDYYQKRYENTGDIILQNEEVGKMVTMESLSNKSIKGIVESMEINLTGGYIADTKIIGEAI